MAGGAVSEGDSCRNDAKRYTCRTNVIEIYILSVR